MLALLALLALLAPLATGDEAEAADFRILPQDATTRALCESVASMWSSPWAQYQQDTFVWHNFLRQLGNNGTYVDVGAYDPHQLSNTAFLDICLGWQGVCIEANPSRRTHFALRHPKRTCTFVDSCVSDGNFEMDLVFAGASEEEPFGSRIEARGSDAPRSGTQTVRCRPLASILRDVEITRVNFLSMDIEGMELRALAVYPFQDIPIDVILVESIAPYQWGLNYLLTMQGFRLEQQLAIDTLYIHRTFPPRPAGQELVYPAQWDEIWRQQAHFRCHHAEAEPCSPNDLELLSKVGRCGTRIGFVRDPDTMLRGHTHMYGEVETWLSVGMTEAQTVGAGDEGEGVEPTEALLAVTQVEHTRMAGEGASVVDKGIGAREQQELRGCARAGSSGGAREQGADGSGWATYCHTSSEKLARWRRQKSTTV